MNDKNTITRKNKIGLYLIILSQIAPIFSVVIPFLGFPEKIEYAIIAMCFVGGKHVILLLGIALAGKKGLILVKHKVMSLLGIPKGKFPATKIQYNIALTIILIWFLTVVVSGYFPELNDIPLIKNNHLWIIIGSDLLFIIAIFFIGGHQMVHKIGKLFKWEPWSLNSNQKI